MGWGIKQPASGGEQVRFQGGYAFYLKEPSLVAGGIIRGEIRDFSRLGLLI